MAGGQKYSESLKRNLKNTSHKFRAWHQTFHNDLSGEMAGDVETPKICMT